MIDDYLDHERRKVLASIDSLSHDSSVCSCEAQGSRWD